jgi:hypothetical protein
MPIRGIGVACGGRGGQFAGERLDQRRGLLRLLLQSTELAVHRLGVHCRAPLARCPN